MARSKIHQLWSSASEFAGARGARGSLRAAAGGGGPRNAVVGMIPFNLTGSTGVQTITSEGLLGGVTPKAVIVMMSARNSASTAQQPMYYSYGFATETQTACTAGWGYYHYTNTAGSGARQKGSTTKLMQLIGKSTIYVEAELNGFEADGFSINVTTASSSRLCWAILFGGDDLNAEVVTANSATTSPTTTFEPDIMFTMSNWGTNFVNDSLSNAYFSSGIVTNDRAGGVSQCSGSHISGSNYQYRHHTCTTSGFATDIQTSGGTIWKNYTCGNFSASGFDISKEAGGTKTHNHAFLCLNWTGGVNLFLDDQFASTGGGGTGDIATTGAGFEPSFGMWFAGRGGSKTTTASHISHTIMAAADPASGSFSWAVGQKDNGNIYWDGNYSMQTNKMAPINHSNPGTHDLFTRTLSSWDSDGYTMNYTTNGGSSTVPILGVLIGF